MKDLEIKTPALGKILQEKRETLGLRINDLAQEIQTTSDYIRALEEENFKVFPAKIYAMGFFKKAVDCLELENKEELVAEFNHQWNLREGYLKSQDEPIQSRARKAPVFTLTKLNLGVGGLILILFIALFSTRLTSFIFPPRLSLASPQTDILLDNQKIEVKGKTEKESQLFMNGREIKIDENGNFKEAVSLPRGFNELVFLAKNRFGKSTQITRYVVVN